MHVCMYIATTERTHMHRYFFFIDFHQSVSLSIGQILDLPTGIAISFVRRLYIYTDIDTRV